MMQVEEELAEQSPGKDTLITIGAFDGVHLGHKFLISELKKNARHRNLLSGVLTFRQHPQELLKTQSKLLLQADLDTKVSLLKNEGVDAVITLTFTDELAQLTARQFIELLQKHIGMQGLVIGPDFALGRNREGNIATLQELGKTMGFSIKVVPPLEMDGEIVSSTAIRNALAQGDLVKVTKFTGRSFDIHGIVATGTQRGRELGFPTANLKIGTNQAIPPDGVYATWVHINGNTYHSMTNIGHSPTFGDNQRTIEIYVIDYQGNLYDSKISIDIIERLREEKKFDNTEELKKQITEDIRNGMAILNSRGNK